MSEKKLSKNEITKIETLKLYDSLPQEKSERIKCTEIRDKIIELNYKFFGYIASHTYIENNSVTYEDKFQSALLHFCECWWWYKWNGDETHKAYRSDLSFAVFYKPRISEMIRRELNEVKYSTRRTLCMEVGKQVGKHWAKVTYEDLKNVNLPVEKMNALKAIFGVTYIADLEEHETYISSKPTITSIEENTNTEYDDIEELLVQEMIRNESKISPKILKKMSEIYDIDIKVLKEKLPVAEAMLYVRINDSLDIIDSFE